MSWSPIMSSLYIKVGSRSASPARRRKDAPAAGWFEVILVANAGVVNNKAGMGANGGISGGRRRGELGFRLLFPQEQIVDGDGKAGQQFAAAEEVVRAQYNRRGVGTVDVDSGGWRIRNPYLLRAVA